MAWIRGEMIDLDHRHGSHQGEKNLTPKIHPRFGCLVHPRTESTVFIVNFTDRHQPWPKTPSGHDSHVASAKLLISLSQLQTVWKSRIRTLKEGRSLPDGHNTEAGELTNAHLEVNEREPGEDDHNHVRDQERACMENALNTWEWGPWTTQQKK